VLLCSFGLLRIASVPERAHRHAEGIDGAMDFREN